MTGIERIAAERKRQVEIKGWTQEHDAEHTNGELVAAAIAYAWHGMAATTDNVTYIGNGKCIGSDFFPKSWHPSWWKPRKVFPHDMTDADRVRHLEKAGALLAAEIDRILNERTPK